MCRHASTGPIPVLWFLLFLAFFPGPTLAQQQGGAIRENALSVFLDCNTRSCDSEYFRTEVGFVNWVRDRTLAQVHLIITSNQTGGGGSVFTLDFIGQEDLEGDDDRLQLTTITTDTEDEILQSLANVLAAGLARYSAAIGQPTAFEVNAVAIEPLTDELVGAQEVTDPWDFWVFEISSDFDLEGEDTERERSFGGSFEARRTTELWKIEFEADANFSRDEREVGGGELIVDERENWSVDVLMARALADHWSLGLIAGAGRSTRRNQDFGGDGALALEYSFFPYEEAPRRSLTARYDLRLQHYEWQEETVFSQTVETRPVHELRLELFQRQPWGETRLSVDGRQFLHDLDLWSWTLSGRLEFRIVRGLNLDLEGDLSRIEDQIFISRGELSDEDILLGRFERPTDITYEFSIGLSFEFGSIFNNVVNNRFDSRNFRGF